MTKFTAAQIHTLGRMCSEFDPDMEVRVTESYRTGTIKVYFLKVRLEIYTNGNWAMYTVHTGNLLEKGEYIGSHIQRA